MDVMHFISRLTEHHTLVKADRGQMKLQEGEVAAGQCSQQLITGRSRFDCMHEKVPPDRFGPRPAGINVASESRLRPK
jgi:hypothetical protein